jgi:hypothetical protein
MPGLVPSGMDMTPSLDSALHIPKVKASCIWTFRERGRILARRKNVLTSFGLTNIAAVWGGTSIAPTYLVIDNSRTTFSNTYASGASSIQTAARIDQPGDTQLVLSPGLVNQEIVTFTSVSGSSPYIYALSSSTTNAHNSGEYVVRQVKQGDNMTNVLGEIQYDNVNNPNKRLQAAGGYSNGVGNWTQQFYFSGSMGQLLFMTVGLSDSNTIGQGNLHNYVVFGLNHISSSNDLEIDVILNITN